jgi:hypothetical protein
MRPLYDCSVEWKRGDLERALTMARDLSGAGATFDARAPALWVRAHAAFALGKDDEVVSAADALKTAAGGGWRSWALPSAQLLAAQALDRKGERAKARARVDEVLATWARADPDLPMLAKALRARLRG